MSLIAVATIEHEDLALGPTIRHLSDVDIEVVTHSGTDPETEMFFFLVSDPTGEFEGLESAIDRDRTVEAWEVVSASEASRMYRIRHTRRTRLLSPTVTELGGLMLEASSTDTGWRVRLQLPDRETLSELWEHCRYCDVTFELERIFGHDDLHDDGVAVTDDQRTALLTAYQEGYFEEPRETSHAELSDLLGVGPTSVGGRLRRGTKALVEELLVDET
ncbi:helix-turn-helix domain-containing protein [Haloarculaceae archaeon H-GB1-1]|nr:helix-turn-helix domain-containing protein [Haloarculaceae archaeon H-GB1-1]